MYCLPDILICVICLGIFSLGSTVRNKYTYATCSSTASGVASASDNAYEGSAAGNSTRGIFSLQAGGVRNKYTYATDTSTACGVGTASVFGRQGSAAGNSTIGIFAIGYNASPYFNVPSTIRNKYTYATCTSTACGVAAASNASTYSSATGNSTRGIFALGQNTCSVGTTTRNKYTYATNTSTASGVGVSSANSRNGAATSWATCVNS